MAIGIDDLDDDDILEPSQDDVPNTPEPPLDNPSDGNEDSFVSDFLRSKGIEDPSRIKFQDDNGNIEERSWDSLTRQEQFNILNTSTTEPVDNSVDLDPEEQALLESIRQSGMTPSQYLQQLQGEQVVQEPVYKVDDLSDDELYIMDLESRVGELSDDEAAQALAVAKQSEELYNKQVEGIRKEYKEREDFQTQQEQAQLEQQQQEAFNQYQEAVINAIDGFNSVGNLDLNFEDSDKQELAEFMLSQDESGNNYLYRALQEPETLVKAAWFILNGDEALNSVSDYFTNQIKLVSENQYKRGFEDGKRGIRSRSSQVVISPKSHSKQYTTIEDLDDEE